MIKVWAILHVTTGNYLPFHQSKSGFSYDEPSTKTRPRLFYTKKAATQALAAWLKGQYEAVYEMESESWEMPRQYRVFAGCKIVEVPYRKKLLMKVVEFDLVEAA